MNYSPETFYYWPDLRTVIPSLGITHPNWRECILLDGFVCIVWRIILFQVITELWLIHCSKLDVIQL
ncbi:hypothetical protein DF185_22875 [Marinifilum breve]|uniref:Uncharacterized protein n=1 Tax=Marinifilum breve TaxID=2184082 RepID=A0A2V3ZRH9_9BACT|nr:hypothetical protein DF185_22875 [Marinifilum breve]